MAYENHFNAAFERQYRCYPVSFIDKPNLENGDKIVMPPSALDCLASLHIEYPMLFELSNTSAGRVTHCGVMEFIADEGLIFLPYWMMENMLLQEGDIAWETSLRSYSCLTTGDTIMVPYNNKKFYIDIVETKPSSAVSIIETDCEVDFALPLDYKEPEKPTSSSLSNRTQPEVQEEPPKKIAKFSPFSGSGRHLDGRSSTQPAAPTSSPFIKPHRPNSDTGIGINGSRSSIASSRQQAGKLVFGSNANHPSNATPKVTPKSSSSQEPPQNAKKKTSSRHSLGRSIHLEVDIVQDFHHLGFFQI